jgi:hypothetical protein
MGINGLTSTMVSAKEMGLGMVGVEVMRGRKVEDEVSAATTLVVGLE